MSHIPLHEIYFGAAKRTTNVALRIYMFYDISQETTEKYKPKSFPLLTR